MEDQQPGGDPRRQRLRTLLDLSGRGLEVGPLNVPVVRRDEADVQYVDVHDRTGLQEVYRPHPGFPLDDIVEPDHVLIAPDGHVRTLSEAVASGAPYDWVVASHVVEHVPDAVGWLRDVAEVLVDDGVLLLVVPDRRLCFDARREPTTVGELLRAHSAGERAPSVRAVYDHYSRCAHVDTARLWEAEPPGPVMYEPSFAWDKAQTALSGTYVDCHVWTWTAGGFVAQLAELAALDLLDFAVDAVLDPPPADLEFVVRLRRLPRGLDRAGREAARAAGITAWTDVEPEPPLVVGGLDDDPATVAATLSASEVRLVLAKRRALHRARRLLRR